MPNKKFNIPIRKNDGPLVSIGIPTYNRPDQLRLAIRSACNQTYKNLEIIISNNCSPDDKTEKIVKRIMKNDKRIHYIKQIKNIGPANNFRFVFEQARGDYFMWLADDVSLEPNFVKSCLEFLLGHNDYSLAAGRAKYYKGDSSFEGEVVNLKQEDPSERVIHYYREIGYNSLYYGLIPRRFFPALVIRHQLADDLIMVARLTFMGKVKVIDSVYSHHSAKGVSTNPEKMYHLYGIDPRRMINHYYFMALKVARDILCSSIPYNTLSPIKRIVLAWDAFKTVLAKQDLTVRQALYTRLHNELSIYKKNLLDIFKKSQKR
jgi:glycosyltransferase involved in cell wall biosynthesis